MNHLIQSGPAQLAFCLGVMAAFYGLGALFQIVAEGSL